MLEMGDTVIVGLSGGADSVCLLSVLSKLKDEMSLTVKAAHVNHGIRGGEADRDEQFCKTLCEKLGVEFFLKKADIPALSKELHLGEEECGRKVRYEFFESLAGENGKIATAHNLNDSVETLLLNLARGSSLKGACSIPPVRGNVIRPLLATDRSEIEEYLKERNLSFVTDSTNLQNEYTRNKIRNEIIPLLKEVNPSAVENMAAFIGFAAEDESFISSKAENAYAEAVNENGELDAEILCTLPESLTRRIANRFLKENIDSEVYSKHIESLLDFAHKPDGSKVNIADVRFKKDGGRIFAYPVSGEGFSVDFKKTDSEVIYAYGTVKLQKQTAQDLQNIQKYLSDNLIDYDKIGDSLKLRSRHEGDSFTFAKRKITKSLKKLFIEEKIPPEMRNRTAVLESGGEVIFVEGFGVNKKFKADDASENILKITVCGEDYGN